MEKDINHIGPFIRLKVINADGKSFSIFVPKGRSGENGWSEIVRVLKELGFGQVEAQKGKGLKGKEKKGYLAKVKEMGLKFAKGGKSFVEVVKKPPFGKDAIAVEL